MKDIARRSFVKLVGSLAVGTSVNCSSDSEDAGKPSGAGGSSGSGGSAGNGNGGSGGGQNGETFEYVVIGSGAGGGPLAANLARNGHSVLLLEAGEDRGKSLEYQVPAFHTQSTEDPAMRWDYFVKHYDDAARRAEDTKYTASEDGVLYPRAGTLGGCTAHNAMITVYPHDSDWDYIAELTGDDSWSHSNMRQYFQRLERCGYLDPSANPPGHGFDGWLPTNRAPTTLVLGDGKLEGTLAAAAYEVSGFLGGIDELFDLINADLNDASPARDGTEAMFTIPLATDKKNRQGPREHILQTVADGHPLTVRTQALASRVLLSDPDAEGVRRALGVEYLEGAHLYRADPNAPKSGAPGVAKTVYASREVIVSCGAFNTPQLLKLSGIGPKSELEALGISLLVELPGVGENLQDRYEVGVITKFDSTFDSLDGCTFGQPGDPCLGEWQNGEGVYTTNGALVGITRRSSADKPLPDLFVFGLPGYFKGYEPGYSAKVSADHSYFTWAILKAHTGNTAGVVQLRTTDPRDVPDVRFRYFDEGSNDAGQATADLAAVTAGVQFVREITSRTETVLFLEDMTEIAPGPAVSSEAEISEFVKKEAWGHHASCTCKIGADSDPMAVLDSKLRVRGTAGLRVVDASIFPKIPGFFIVAPIYMVSEKATEDILADIGETRNT